MPNRKRNKSILTVLCIMLMMSGCRENTTNAATSEDESTEVDDIASEKSEKQIDIETEDAEQEDTQEEEFVALEGDGSGFAMETYSNITYLIPDTWKKRKEEEAESRWYIDTENGGIMFIQATSFDDVENSELQNMLVDAPMQSIKNYEDYSDWGTSEGMLEYGNRYITTLYSYTSNGDIQVGEALILNDLEAVVSIVYAIPAKNANDEALHIVANDIFNSVQLINTP